MKCAAGCLRVLWCVRYENSSVAVDVVALVVSSFRPLHRQSWTARTAVLSLSHHSQRLAAAAVYGEATAIASAINKLKQRAAQRETHHA